MTTQTREIVFPAERLSSLQARLAELAETAKRLGVEPMTFEETDRFQKRDDFGFEWTYLTGTLHGTVPVLPGGWRVLGAIEHMEAGNLVSTFGDDDLEHYRHAAPDCDHCGLRRNRRYTVVLADEEGTVVQVGKSCLVDFVGHGDPERVLYAFSEFNDDLDEMMGAPRSRDYGIDTEDLLTLANAVVRIYGWVPKSAQFTTSTYDYVMDILYPPKGKDASACDPEVIHRVREAARSNARNDREQAQEAMAWTRALPADSTDYLGNLRSVVSQDNVDIKHAGLAISAIAAFAKAQDREVAREREQNLRATSEFVGTVGKREEFDIEVTRIRAIDSMYGTKYLVTMADADGNILKTFNSGQFGIDAEVGDKLRIKATVKVHEVYNDANETLLARVALIADLDPEEG